MRYVAAYLLAALGGNASPSADEIKTILSSVGVGVDDEKLAFVMAQLAGKSIDEVVASGLGKLASVPSGGGGAAAKSGGAAAGDAPAEVEEEKEPEPDSDEESDDDMGFSLFD
ncbi:large ribosomal subunit protein P2-like [Bolinopsis microptera]|uniref:large ribosomal subunit protein P2-like n=1 Tax=Bolinopsis microptera TaxID=2820187 RepID=UPI00307B0138